MHTPPFQAPDTQSPAPLPPDAAPHYLYPRATAGKRFLNHLIDSVAAYAVIFSYGLGVGYLTIAVPKASLLIDGTSGTIIVYALFVGYFLVMELTTGRTLGKLITNTRVVNLQDTDASWKQILGRTAARFIPFEPLSFLGANASGWHDTLSKTKVIDTSKPPNVIMTTNTPMRPFNPNAGRPIKRA